MGNDDRSRYGNFMGGNLSPLKRGRSPMRSMHRLSPSPKRPFLDQRMGLPSPRRNDFRKIDDMQLPTPGEASMALKFGQIRPAESDEIASLLILLIRAFDFSSFRYEPLSVINF